MIRTYKRKLRLTGQQTSRLDSWLGACRVVYNLGLEIKIAGYKATGKSPSAFDLMKQLPALRKDYDWIADVPADTLQVTLSRLDRSYTNFFRGKEFPRWASKKHWVSIGFKAVRILNDGIQLPKIGVLKIFKDAPIQGISKTAQIIKEPTGYFICIQCELPDSKLCGDSQAIVGLDMGIAHFCIDSDGTFYENPKHFAKYERKLRVIQRALARKKKDSSGWKKQVTRLARLHHAIGNTRRDYLHKLSTQFARQYSIVFLEDLNIEGLAKSPKLAKHILDCGWGMFKNMLSYKTAVIKINPSYTSQTCSACGFVDKESRKSRSKFCCTACGFESDADVNAAKNILGRGTALKRQREALACA